MNTKVKRITFIENIYFSVFFIYNNVKVFPVIPSLSFFKKIN